MTRLEEPDDKDFINALFGQLPPVEPSAKLEQRIGQIPVEYPRSNVIVWPFRSLWQPTLALVAAACVGFFVGENVNEASFVNSEELAELESGSGLESESTGDTAGPTEDEGEATNSVGDEDLDGLLVLATLGDFEASDWETSLDSETQFGPEAQPIEEETF